MMRAVQLFVPESTDQEMAVIYERTLDAGVRETRGQLRLPHSLRKPQAGRLHTEAPLQELAHSADLLEPIGAGERREDRLVESREQQLQPAFGGKPANHVEPRRVVLFQPLEQRTRDVQREREKPGGGGSLDNRPIDVAHMVGHDVVEIPHGLMQVQAKYKPQRGRGRQEGVGCGVCRNTSTFLASPNFSMNPASSRPLSAPASVIACAA